MSANKTIKALREERDQLYAEIRRLQAVAGEQPSIREMARDARVGLRVAPSAPVERDERAEFKREDRYIVIKRSGLDKVPVSYRNALINPLLALRVHLPRRECLVIESDWPEYEPAWAAIEARVTGKSTSAPKPAGYISDIGLARLRAGRSASLIRARTNRMTNALYLEPNSNEGANHE